MAEGNSIARKLTDVERALIQQAQARIPEAERFASELVRRAVAHRDSEIAAAVDAGASPTDIAQTLGMSRQAIYDAVKRTSDS